MLGNGILETTTGATTGDLTLTGVTNRPRFSDVFAANATEASADVFYYSILTQDTIPILVEQGIGWLSATGTLKRGSILATYSSGVPTYGGSAFSLTSGSTYNVICTPEAAAVLSGVHALASLTGGGTVRSIGPAHIGPTNSSAAAVKDRLYYVPIRVDTPVLVKSIRVNCGGAGGAGGTRGFRVGLYSCLRTGLPGRKLYESGDLVATAYAARTYDLNGSTGVRLMPGWYFVALVHDYGTTAPTFYGASAVASNHYNNTPLGKSTTTGIEAAIACYEALSASWSRLPSTASGTQTAIASITGVFCPLLDVV